MNRIRRKFSHYDSLTDRWDNDHVWRASLEAESRYNTRGHMLWLDILYRNDDQEFEEKGIHKTQGVPLFKHREARGWTKAPIIKTDQKSGPNTVPRKNIPEIVKMTETPCGSASGRIRIMSSSEQF